jgi:metallo-beta-lactamase family protein
MLPDSAYLQERDIEYINKKNRKKGIPQVEPIYEMTDALDAIRLVRPHKLNTWFQVAEDVEVMFIEAGHVLGAALTKLRIKEGSYIINLGYIVDLGRKGLPLLNDPEQMRDVDYALIESTYGNKFMKTFQTQKKNFLK